MKGAPAGAGAHPDRDAGVRADTHAGRPAHRAGDGSARARSPAARVQPVGAAAPRTGSAPGRSTRSFPLMIFCAGFGTRMGALTRSRPKPLIPLAGRALLDHALDLADAAHAAPIVVNTHYLGEQIADHVARRPDIAISDERAQILDTGGGLRAALPLLGPGPVMTLNPDALWRGPNPLRLLAQAWEPDRMDALLLVRPRAGLPGRSGSADFTLDHGRIRRTRGPAGVVYLGAQILCPQRLSAIPEPVFSLNRLWDEMIAAGRAHALEYPGTWCDIGTPEGLALAESMLRGGG